MSKRQRQRQIFVRTLSSQRSTGWLEFGPFRFRCALGRAGLRARKREGDQATPMGVYRLGEARFRPDRGRRFQTGLVLKTLRRQDGWCDTVGDRNYNRLVRYPYSARAEQMWREDGLYDVVVVSSFNILPRVQGLGSAIFLHVARPGYLPTEGCIALAKADLVRLLSRLRAGDVICLGPFHVVHRRKMR